MSLESLKKRRDDAAASSRTRYVQLIRQLADKGQLAEPQVDELDRLATSLAYPFAQIEKDVALCQRAKKLEKTAAELESRREAYTKLATALTEYRAETERIQRERGEKALRMRPASITAFEAIGEAQAAGTELMDLRKTYPELLPVI